MKNGSAFHPLLRPPELPVVSVKQYSTPPATAVAGRAAMLMSVPFNAVGDDSKPAVGTVHSLCQALKSPDGLIYGDENELLQLASRTREWQRPLTILTTSPFRLCFRLEEPIEEEENEENEWAGAVDGEIDERVYGRIDERVDGRGRIDGIEKNKSRTL